MKQRNIYRILITILVPLLYALALRELYDLEDGGGLYGIMTLGFIFFVPFCVGALTIFLSPVNWAEKKRDSIMLPWIPIGLFAVVTLAFSIEGWACWVMVLPLFLFTGSLGGLTARHFRLKDQREKTYISVTLLLPFLVTPIEGLIGDTPSTYKAYTVTDIHASKADIWRNVTRVSEISAEEDKAGLTGWMGFPRPIKAELNYEGVGAFRKAVFDKGLEFHEEVTAYEHEKSMTFTIKADPYAIPSTTMDEHVVIGGKYFDVKDGTYELEVLNDSTCRLHLYSHFKLNTHFNFYARWWAGWIMEDIQDNILQVVKRRAE